MTKEQENTYLSNPNHCPYCGSEDIEADPVDADWKEAWGEVECGSCEKRWMDVYRLIAVEEVKQ